MPLLRRLQQLVVHEQRIVFLGLLVLFLGPRAGPVEQRRWRRRWWRRRQSESEQRWFPRSHPAGWRWRQPVHSSSVPGRRQSPERTYAFRSHAHPSSVPGRRYAHRAEEAPARGSGCTARDAADGTALQCPVGAPRAKHDASLRASAECESQPRLGGVFQLSPHGTLCKDVNFFPCKEFDRCYV